MFVTLRHCAVEDIAAPVRNALVGGPFGSDLVGKDYVGSGVPVIRGQNMGHGRWVSGDFVFVSEEKAAALAANTARPMDLVFTQRGTLGQVALVPSEPFERYIVSQSQMKLTVDDAKADSVFLYYVFSAPSMIEYIRNHAIQTGVPHTNLGILRKTPLHLPPLTDQRAIAHILGMLDDKIELNRRMNKTLEEIARAIFKSWFIDFDPVRAKAEGRQPAGVDAETAANFPDAFEDSELGPIPAGWYTGRLEDLLVLQRGFDLPNTQRIAGNCPVMAASGPSGTHNEAKVKGPGVTTGRSGVLGKVYFVHEDFWPLNTSLWVKSFPHSTPTFAYMLLRTLDFSHFNAGSAVPTLNRNHVHGLPVVVPPHRAIKAFDEIALALFRKARANELESETLGKIRDALLPKLLSGEIRVPEAERQLAEVAV